MSALRKVKRDKARTEMKKKGFIHLNRGKRHTSVFSKKWREFV